MTDNVGTLVEKFWAMANRCQTPCRFSDCWVSWARRDLLNCGKSQLAIWGVVSHGILQGELRYLDESAWKKTYRLWRPSRCASHEIEALSKGRRYFFGHQIQQKYFTVTNIRSFFEAFLGSQKKIKKPWLHCWFQMAAMNSLPSGQRSGRFWTVVEPQNHPSPWFGTSCFTFLVAKHVVFWCDFWQQLRGIDFCIAVGWPLFPAWQVLCWNYSGCDWGRS